MAALVAVLCELAIALPFLVISPNTLRGVPGPLLVVIGVVASYLLGPWLGVPVTAVAVVLAVTIVGENAWAAPLVWLPVSAGAGIVGEQVRHGDELRRELIEELRRGLVGIYRDPAVGRLNVVSRYIPAVSAQRIAGDFYGAVVQPTGDVAIMVGDVAGHGPAAAALATRLRAMWRGLAIAGVSDSETVSALNETLLAEQQRIASQIPFATLCLATVAADLRSAQIVIAGHPPPILVTARGTHEDAHPAGPAIGISGDLQLGAASAGVTGRALVAGRLHRRSDRRTHVTGRPAPVRARPAAADAGRLRRPDRRGRRGRRAAVGAGCKRRRAPGRRGADHSLAALAPRRCLGRHRATGTAPLACCSITTCGLPPSGSRNTQAGMTSPRGSGRGSANS